MVVDQRGIGARMVARYPTQPPDTPDASKNEDIFYTLTPRQMAKLFRTKKSLCGQPMTLSVNSTVFCCRAILMESEESPSQEDSGTTPDMKDNLVLFSVIVALSSPEDHTSTSIPFSGWFEGASDDQFDLQRYFQTTNTMKDTVTARASPSFLSIRRVHLSLARYCRVLEREERRCHYISNQIQSLFEIRGERQKFWDEQKASGLSPGKGSGGVSSGSTKAGGSERRNRHMRNSSLTTYLTLPSEQETNISSQGQSGANNSVLAEQEKEQEILELMLAAASSGDETTPTKTTAFHGNIVRELVQVFHSLSRNDHEFSPTPDSILTEREGTVYVNQHIALPIEAVTLDPTHSANPIVRPYFTLLFPHASPSELLQTFQDAGSTAPQRLSQLLLTVNPQKSLADISTDANLPLYTTMEIASFLIAHGACVASPVVSRSSRLACQRIGLIKDLGLEFSQIFPNVNMFRLVSFLTSANNLGEAMSTLVESSTEEGIWLRESLSSYFTNPEDLPDELVPTVDDSPTTGAAAGRQKSRWVEEFEELLYAMTIWLLSHRVLSQIQEYFVLVDVDGDSAFNSSSATLEADDDLFRELMDAEYLNGDVTISALSWKTGLDQTKLKAWGLRHQKIRLVCRTPRPGDDFELDALQ